MSYIDPWNIIGWAVLAVLIGIGVISLVNVLRCTISNIKDFVGHLRTRNDTPKPGQVWVNDHDYHVETVHDDGSVSLRSGNTYFGRNAENWKKFVRNKKLRRIK